MKIKEVIVPKLQGFNLDNKTIDKSINANSVSFKKYDETLLCSESGVYTYKKGVITQLDRNLHSTYCMKKMGENYICVDNVKEDNIDELIFINEYTPLKILTNVIPFTHTSIKYTKNIIKLSQKSNLELVVENYENMDSKVYFNIFNDFDINSKNIRDELNTLISFLQK